MQLITSCPVCGGALSILPSVDFNKNCEEARGKVLPASGLRISYSLCKDCEFAFSPQIWGWSEAEFSSKIYNNKYIEIDPDYVEVRPRENAGLLANTFAAHKTEIRHLDYGGGNGKLSKILAENGWNSQTYDPFPKNDINIQGLGKFNFISAFEVFEHVPDVHALMRNITTLMDRSCFVLFSTLISEGRIQKNVAPSWWYCSPRNGHISLFSNNSLFTLASKYNLKYGRFSENLHFFFNDLPPWAGHLIKT